MNFRVFPKHFRAFYGGFHGFIRASTVFEVIFLTIYGIYRVLTTFYGFFHAFHGIGRVFNLFSRQGVANACGGGLERGRGWQTKVCLSSVLLEIIKKQQVFATCA